MHTQRQRALLILDFERTMSRADKENKDWHPDYVHIRVPANEVEEEVHEEDVGAPLFDAGVTIANH
jgi:hypothetical protein|eukprot:SAG25_NODE_1231_length_3554_cov_14.316932_2_plen_66_part_00